MCRVLLKHNGLLALLLPRLNNVLGLFLLAYKVAVENGRPISLTEDLPSAVP